MRCTDGSYEVSKQDIYNAVLVLDFILQDIENGKLPKYFDSYHIERTNIYLIEYVNNFYNKLNPTR